MLVALLTHVLNLNIKKMTHFSLCFLSFFLIISNFLSIQLSLRQRTWEKLVLRRKEQVNYITNIFSLLKMNANYNFDPNHTFQYFFILSQTGINSKHIQIFTEWKFFKYVLLLVKIPLIRKKKCQKFPQELKSIQSFILLFQKPKYFFFNVLTPYKHSVVQAIK